MPRIGLECRTADNLQCVITEGVPLSQYAVRKYTTEVTYNTVRGLLGAKRRCELLAMAGGKIDWELAHRGKISDLRVRVSDSHH